MRNLILVALVAIPFAANADGSGSAGSYSTSGTGAVSSVVGNGLAIQESVAGAWNSSGVAIGYDGGSSLDLYTYSYGDSYSGSYGYIDGNALGETAGGAYEGGFAGAEGYFDF